MMRATTVDDVQGRELAEEFVMDEEAFRDFYERTARGLWAYLARVAGDRHLADDLLQETFYRFLKSAGSYESEAHRRNTVYRIATNLACDVRRRRATSGGPAAVAGDEIERVASSEDPGRVQRRAEFDAAMARLNPRERAMLWLAYAEGASHRDIADASGVEASSVKVMLFRARRKLAGLLGGSR
jgi:RNA polymerase sigma-70 factor (ECF subfamily)